MLDCKTIDAKVGHLDVKVLVELHEQWWLGVYYKMTVKMSAFPNQVYSIKGDYYIVRLAFDSFNVETANKMAENASKIVYW